MKTIELSDEACRTISEIRDDLTYFSIKSDICDALSKAVLNAADEVSDGHGVRVLDAAIILTNYARLIDDLHTDTSLEKALKATL